MRWEDIDDTLDIPSQVEDGDSDFFERAEQLRATLLNHGIEEGLSFEESPLQAGGTNRASYWGWEFIIKTPGAELAASIELTCGEESSYRVSVYIPRGQKVRVYSVEDTCIDPVEAADFALADLMELIPDVEELERSNQRFGRVSKEALLSVEDFPGTDEGREG